MCVGRSGCGTSGCRVSVCDASVTMLGAYGAVWVLGVRVLDLRKQLYSIDWAAAVRNFKNGK